MRRVLCGLFVVAAALVISGCGAVAQTDGVLLGGTFLSTEVSRELVAGTQIRLDFTDGAVRVNAGCNHLSGTVAIEGDRLVVTDMAGTQMGCDHDRHAQDEWLGEFLTRQPQWTLDGDTLTLRDGSDTVVLVDREVAEPDRPLERTRWLVDGVISGDSVSSAPARTEAEAVLVFDEGQVLGETGCSGFSGPATVAGDKVAVGQLASTLVECDGERGDLERAVRETLVGDVHFEIEAGQLTLTNADGVGLMLRAIE